MRNPKKQSVPLMSLEWLVINLNMSIARHPRFGMRGAASSGGVMSAGVMSGGAARGKLASLMC